MESVEVIKKRKIDFCLYIIDRYNYISEKKLDKDKYEKELIKLENKEIDKVFITLNELLQSVSQLDAVNKILREVEEYGKEYVLDKYLKNDNKEV